MFDMQRFAEDKAIPAELAGISEDVARNIMAQAGSIEKPASDSQVDANNPGDVKVSYSRFKETLDQKNDIERQLAAYREKFGDLNAQPQPQPDYPPQNYQQAPQPTPQPVQNLTEDLIKNFEDAITYGAKQLSGFSDEQVEELDYLDDDDPRIKQWQFAKRIAESAVYNNYLSAQFAQQQELQRQALIQNQTATAFNDYTTRQQAEENFNAVRQFATTDFYNSLNDVDKWTISNAQSHIMNNTASPSDFMVIRDFFSRAKAEYDSRRTPLPFKGNNAPQFPRTDKVNGVSGGGGGINNATLSISPELVKVGWAKDTWESGLHRAFFDKFTGNSPENIIQIREELSKDDGDTINIPLLMPLVGAGVEGDDWLEGTNKLTRHFICARLTVVAIS